jgi:hypothetical protein
MTIPVESGWYLPIDFDWYVANCSPTGPCAYCGERAQEVVCRGHSAWLGEGLCEACEAACLAEVPVLPGAPYTPHHQETP